MMFDAHLALAGRRQFDLVIRQYFRTTVLVHSHRCDHDNLLRTLTANALNTWTGITVGAGS
jgi:hypothetical protein